MTAYHSERARDLGSRGEEPDVATEVSPLLQPPSYETSNRYRKRVRWLCLALLFLACWSGDILPIVRPSLLLAGFWDFSHYDEETGISTQMFFETRIFFLVDEEDDSVLQRLTLDDAAVSQAMFPDDPIGFGTRIEKEERVDDYILVEGFAGAEEIGLKVRGTAGGSRGLLELKTPIRNATKTKDLALWKKSSKKTDKDPMDPKVILAFLALCNDQPQARPLAEWIQNQPSSSLKVVQSSKRRRFAFIENATMNIQEADIEFYLGETGYQEKSTNRPVLRMRSWSAEALKETPKLRSIAETWNVRFGKALLAAQLEIDPPMWIASYPEMILKVPRLLGRK